MPEHNARRPRAIGQDFPAVPVDLLAELEFRFPATFPVSAAVLDPEVDPVALKVAMARVQGRRDVLDLLRAAVNARRPTVATADGPAMGGDSLSVGVEV